jgi:hypothetical protein
MSNVLGILAFLLFIAVIVGLAAGITWLVVRLSPPKAPDAPSKP